MLELTHAFRRISRPVPLKEIIKDPRSLLNYLLYHLFCMTEPFAPGSDKFKLAWEQCSTS